MAEEKGFTADYLIGKTLEQAQKDIEGFGYTLRVTKKNGSNVIGTRDYRTDRLNVGIQDGKISEVFDVG